MHGIQRDEGLILAIYLSNLIVRDREFHVGKDRVKLCKISAIGVLKPW
jgi:hypothetical protein